MSSDYSLLAGLILWRLNADAGRVRERVGARRSRRKIAVY
jgi:hypothetical protein